MPCLGCTRSLDRRGSAAGESPNENECGQQEHPGAYEEQLGADGNIAIQPSQEDESSVLVTFTTSKEVAMASDAQQVQLQMQEAEGAEQHQHVESAGDQELASADDSIE
ncbi:hypothetical protein pipiens_011279 [Culex pipiens pipiens]|uniref:Uncharacterized protein n=1 Tax=Culex pipiens pipiens TaxID=38569 RepID=A0ABD1D7T8_CULPP